MNYKISTIILALTLVLTWLYHFDTIVQKDKVGANAMSSNKGNMMMVHQMPDGSMMGGNQMSMDSMMKDMMAGLDGKTGDAFDQAFLSEMIVHHTGAVVMAEAVLKNSKRPELLKLAHDIISAQTGEITMMKNWQKSWFGK